MQLTFLSLIFGSFVGLSLGLTGGGGALFAVPLLTYGLELSAANSVAISLITVGITALLGFWQRARRGEVEFPTGLLFAAAGMIGAPAGSWVAAGIPATVLLGCFALLMVSIALRMWRGGSGIQDPVLVRDAQIKASCERGPDGRLRITSGCALRLAVVGLLTGLLTGLFGVGGGFIIVPALVLFSGMELHRAIGTSLFVITLISISAIASRFALAPQVPEGIAATFATGSLAGIWTGSSLAGRLDGRTLQRLFAVMIFLMAIYMVIRSLLG